jgi:hypothetical protein
MAVRYLAAERILPSAGWRPGDPTVAQFVARPDNSRYDRGAGRRARVGDARSVAVVSVKLEERVSSVGASGIASMLDRTVGEKHPDPVVSVAARSARTSYVARFAYPDVNGASCR